MHYIKVTWIHDLVDEPVLLYHEIDSDNYETRKIEVFRNGSILKVSKALENGNDLLSDQPIPAVEEVNIDPQFKAVEISKEDFERVWYDID